jgi:hypothetical protein
MFDTDKEGSLFIWAAVAIVVLVCGIHWFQVRSREPVAVPATVPPESDTAPHPEEFVTVPVPDQGQATPPIATVYECRTNGQRVLSGSPCGPDAREVEVQAPNRMNAQDTSRLYERSYTPNRVSAGDGAELTDAELAGHCKAIEEAIDWIDARMREGYRNGEDYRERLRQLKEGRWDLKCRWVKTPKALRR